MATDRGQGAAAAEWNALSRDEVLRRIEALAADFLECLSDGKLLELEARNSSALVYDHQKQRQVHGNDKRLVKLTAHALLTESKTATQRDVYYLHPFFKGQSEADEAILAVDIKWIGVRPSQVATLGLPQSSFKALTQKDIAVANSLLQASFVQANEHYRREVRMWLEDSLPWKIELEALHFLGFTFLTSFLQDCIEGDNFL
ncbi:hypothetical protein PR002_g12217 [Phytophthora rubi]|uniref:Topoisomerase 6 subunit A/Spo11 TOPRIM domain-containing protein n=1 Tax=Phytophthora rubi TaxID=129364 RepID=A0A6A3LTV5_9STRA|nr:hypothetical protein PR002_g12217 [Phytophthora rubi]